MKRLAVFLVVGCTTGSEAPAERKAEPAAEAKQEVKVEAKVPDLGKGIGAADEEDVWGGLGDSIPDEYPDGAAQRVTPAGPKASASERKDAVAKLFAGGPTVTRLPLRATDTGEEFDPGLRARINRGPVPRVRQAKADIRGPLDKNIIRRIVRSRMSEVRFCYDKLLKRDPKAAGTIGLKWTVKPDGTVGDVKKGKGSLRDKALHECLLKRIAGWRFPKADKPTTVSYPFNLAPG